MLPLQLFSLSLTTLSMAGLTRTLCGDTRDLGEIAVVELIEASSFDDCGGEGGVGG